MDGWAYRLLVVRVGASTSACCRGCTWGEGGALFGIEFGASAEWGRGALLATRALICPTDTHLRKRGQQRREPGQGRGREGRRGVDQQQAVHTLRSAAQSHRQRQHAAETLAEQVHRALGRGVGQVSVQEQLQSRGGYQLFVTVTFAGYKTS